MIESIEARLESHQTQGSSSGAKSVFVFTWSEDPDQLSQTTGSIIRAVARPNPDLFRGDFDFRTVLEAAASWTSIIFEPDQALEFEFGPCKPLVGRLVKFEIRFDRKSLRRVMIARIVSKFSEVRGSQIPDFVKERGTNSALKRVEFIRRPLTVAFLDG